MHTMQLPFPAADPFILRTAQGRYYLYCTSEDGNGFPIRVSADLQHWELCATALGPGRSRWGKDRFWAPECYEIQGRYYLFYSADWKENPTGAEENFRIGVAVSDAPEGPFTDLTDHPIFDPGYPIIDANVYEESGRYFLYYSRCCYEHPVGDLEESWIYGVELKPDFSGVVGDPVLLLRPEQEWEGRSAPQTGRRWNEGSFLLRHNGTYFMTYSANFFGGPDYAVGYATASNPLGPYTKAAENPILQRGGPVTGTGHSCLFRAPDDSLMICYHGRTEVTGEDRIAFLAPVQITGDGRMQVCAF